MTDGFAQIAPFLSHPLVLVGFALLLFFGLLRAILGSGLMPQVSQAASGRTLQQLLRYGFIAALVAVVLGFLLAYVGQAPQGVPGNGSESSDTGTSG